MKNLLIYFVATFSLLTLSSSLLVSQEEMTLEKAIAIGIENNFGLKIAEKNIAIAENNNSWASAGKGPTVDLNGSFTNNFTDNNNPASFIQALFYNGALSASLDGNWVIYSGGRFQIIKNQLDLQVDQQRLLQSQEMHNLLREIAQRYAAVIYQMERKAFLSEVFALSKQRLNYENVKREFGQSNSYNILQFEDAVNADSINLISQNNQIDIAERNLYLTLDIPNANANYIFNEKLNATIEVMEVDKLKEALEEENYTLKTLNVLARLDQLNTNLQESARKPTVSVNGSLGFTESAFKIFDEHPQPGERYKLQFGNQISLGANILANWNIYDGNLKRQNIQTAKLQEEITQLNMLEAKAELYNQLDILLQNYNYQLDLLNMTDIQINNARKNIEISEERFKAGQITSLDYRAAQNQFLRAADSRITAIYNLIISKSEIDWLVGSFE